MKRYKGILLSSTLLIATSGFAAQSPPPAYKATTPVKKAATAPAKKAAAVPAKKAVPGNHAVQQWEPHAMGGTATLESNEDIEIIMNAFQTDELKKNTASFLDAWTVTAGIGYIFPLFDALVYSEDVQWFTAIQPQVNAYYLDGDFDGTVDRFSNYTGNFADNDYTIEFQSTRVMLDASLTVMSWRKLSFYVIGGAGYSWNSIDLETHATDCVLGADLDNDDTNFVWEAGAGVTLALTDNLGVSFQYLYVQFEDLALGEDGTLGEGSTETVLSDIESDNFDLTSQAVMAGFRYAF